MGVGSACNLSVRFFFILLMAFRGPGPTIYYIGFFPSFLSFFFFSSSSPSFLLVKQGVVFMPINALFDIAKLYPPDSLASINFFQWRELSILHGDDIKFQK